MRRVLRDQRFVALVKGGDQKGRERVFAGFNTPCCRTCSCARRRRRRDRPPPSLPPRHHYDLAWNPAVLEQRTGRIDRIGIQASASGACQQVGGPSSRSASISRGNLRRRMYEELRLRAQVFEVLTGGEVAATTSRAKTISSRRREMIRVFDSSLAARNGRYLRVHLHVWSDGQRPPQ